MAALVFVGMQFADKPTIGVGGFTDRGCTTETSSAVTLTPDTSATVLAASSRRAWARIQHVQIPLDIVWLSFDEGAAATTTKGIILATSTTATEPTLIEFGLNTDNPYTGEVTGLAVTATTTVLVSECRY